MEKIKSMVKEPVKTIVIAGIIYFVAVAVKAAYFTQPWYKFW
jgi:hypothetical protein